MIQVVSQVLSFLNQLLTAGVAITAFSLLLFALSFNLRDKVARSFALVLACVVIVFVGDAFGSNAASNSTMETWLRLEWVGITFLPAVYLHLSDSLLATTGRPSRGRRALLVKLSYIASVVFLIALPLKLLVGPLVPDAAPAPHLKRTWLTLIFTVYYLVVMLLAVVNFIRAYQRTIATTSRRRMGYLILGASAPALGSYPYLLFGSGFAAQHPLFFWIIAVISNLFVSILLILMAYAIAFFGVDWPDRVVKRRLFKWLMRGPFTASTALAITTLIRRSGEQFGFSYNTLVPIIMVASILIIEFIITLAAPHWERWLFHSNDTHIALLQNFEERLLSAGDLYQFLESVLAAVCDRLQRDSAFLMSLSSSGLEMMVTIGGMARLNSEELSGELMAVVSQNGAHHKIFLWGEYLLIPLYPQRSDSEQILGIIGVYRKNATEIEPEHSEALEILAQKAGMAIEDSLLQQQAFSSLQALAPQVETIQRWRALARYDDGASLIKASTDLMTDQGKFERWVKDALTHYWGGPKLTGNPLMRLEVVQQALGQHDGNPTNALRAILRQAVEQTRPEGERRFTGEWLLYNLLELKFMEGKSVREVALRLAMSEADLYRKQRVAVEAVAKVIVAMETVVNSTQNNHQQTSNPEKSFLRGGVNG
jgi:hypothetical protein